MTLLKDPNLLLLLLILPATGMLNVSYSPINGFLCIRSDFVETPEGVATVVTCAIRCSLNQRCQAFTVADGPCRLFVFDKCSKSVRDCGCSRRGQVFVKRQPGLEAGVLCPSGYGDDLCGVKYKLHFGMGTWWPSRQKCESESGLVIMADVIDAIEMSRVDQIFTMSAGGKSFWLGGFQRAGSPEPDGGWYWVGCNITLDGRLWGTGEPDDKGAAENTIGRWSLHDKLSDFRDTSGTPGAVLCECVSPFN